MEYASLSIYRMRNIYIYIYRNKNASSSSLYTFKANSRHVTLNKLNFIQDSAAYIYLYAFICVLISKIYFLKNNFFNTYKANFFLGFKI